VLVKAIRVNQFFQDFDGLRSGFCSKPHFRSALSVAGLCLTEPELGLLEQQYRHPTANDRVCWKSFADDMNLVFNQQGFEQQPRLDGNLRYVPGTESLNPNYIPTKEVTLRTVSEQEDQRISDILESCVSFLDNHRIVALYQYFQQFDQRRSGKVSKHQFFRVLDGINFCVTPHDQELVCKRYMDIGDKVNYTLFCDDVQPDRVPAARDTAVPGFEGSPPLSITKPWESKLKPPPTPEVEISNLLDLMRAHVVRERVRTYDAMHAHDRHNTGKMHPVKFKSVLNQLGFVLKPKEVAHLEEYLADGVTGHINYRKFVDAMESSFTQKGLEREPTVKVKSFQPMMPSDEVQPLESEADEADTDYFMSRIANDFALRRIQPKSFFQQYDRCHIGSVTPAQFKAIMKNLDCALSDYEFEKLQKRYSKEDRRICGDIGYVKFCRDLVAMVANPPIQTSFGPGTDGPM
jgi:Ca2+-binding EF-hand superfamily protein